ncbi:MAG: hypothetical protein BWX59_00130 [Bacteroidetes bacterium ADurb.Bin028]|nr:MAG: hypothetical protein BWX59_00130 [Bacteroidetes bacterium ADurb.Bin028]
MLFTSSTLNSGKINAKVKWQTTNKIEPNINIEAALPLLSTYFPNIGVIPTANNGNTAKIDSAD